SNLVLFNENKVIGLFRQAIENDWLLQKNEFDQPNYEQESEPMPAHYYIYAMEAEGKRKIVFRFEPIEGIAVMETLVIFEALTFFARTYLAEYQFQLKKQVITGKYQQALKRQQSLLHGAQTRMHYLQTQVPPDEIANIIMANLHVLKKEETEVNLFDFYRDQNITIKLKKEWSPQKNAELYYKKAKNKKLEWEQAEQQIEKSTLLIRQISEQLAQALNITQTKEFKKFDQETSFINSGSKNNMNNEHGQPHEMFKLFTCNGYSIYVGKNAANNDQLTLKFAKKEDLWLHARGVSGSHVVIKHKNKDTPFPASVIEFAAQLAAYYSKAKSSSLVPVIYTCKKFVRKPKGALPGQVKVEKEEVLLVEPKLPIKDA
ncbi:MAG: DUF814 domain-containing protein, partial [Bacteroidia bacterium]|nr:DUF814 domain-containing protein [Bacteroidia bacterium]